MSSFQIKTLGLGKLEKDLAPTRIKKQVALAIGESVLEFHNILENSISKAYNAPNKLGSVLVGNSISTETKGRNIIKSGLEYKFKPIPLVKFPFVEREVPADAGFLTHGDKGKGWRVQKKNYALGVFVSVKKGAGKRVKGRKGYGGFYLNPARRNTGDKPWQVSKNHRRGIYEREQADTWKGLFNRNKLTVLFAPSLSQMAHSRLREDREVQLAFNRFSDRVLINLKL